MYRDPLQAWRDSSVKNERDFARVYAEKVQQVLDDIKSFGRSVAAFICESVLGCAGQVVLVNGLNPKKVYFKKTGESNISLSPLSFCV